MWVSLPPYLDPGWKMCSAQKVSYPAALAHPLANKQNFTNVLASLIHFTKDHDNPTVQKMAFNILLKMVHSWLIISPDLESQSKVTQQFREQFLEFAFQTIIPISFEIPMLKTFDLTDGQTVLVSCLNSL